MLQTPQKYPRAGSQSYPSPAAEAAADGSTTVWFAPNSPRAWRAATGSRPTRRRAGSPSCASTARCRRSSTSPGGRARSSWCSRQQGLWRTGASGRAASPLAQRARFADSSCRPAGAPGAERWRPSRTQGFPAAAGAGDGRLLLAAAAVLRRGVLGGDPRHRLPAAAPRLRARSGRANLAATLSVLVCIVIAIIPMTLIVGSLIAEGAQLVEQVQAGEIDPRRCSPTCRRRCRPGRRTGSTGSAWATSTRCASG